MNKNSSFLIGFIISAGLHVTTYLAINILIPGLPKAEISPTSTERKIKVTLVEEGQRVDIIGMPTHTLKELLELEKIRITNKRVEQKKALFQDMLKSIVKKAERTQLTRPIGEPKVLLMAGNKLSEGMALAARERDPKLGEFHGYLEYLPQHIKKKWKLPSYLLGKDLRCRIRIIIAENGELINFSLIESSGDEEFDRRALQATKESNPFPKPNNSITSLLRQGHIILGFPE